MVRAFLWVFPFAILSHAAETRIAPIAGIRDFVWDATRSRAFVSTQSSIVILNWDSNAIDDTVATGIQADKIAISDDGQFLYASVVAEGTILRYRVANHQLEQSFRLPSGSALGLAVLPGKPNSIVVMVGPSSSLAGSAGAVADFVAIYDDGVQRPNTVPHPLRSLYARQSDGGLFGWSLGRLFRFVVTPTGLSVAWSAPLDPAFGLTRNPHWVGDYLFDNQVFNLDKRHFVGSFLPTATGPRPEGCIVPIETRGAEILAVRTLLDDSQAGTSTLERISMPEFRPVASSSAAADWGNICSRTSWQAGGRGVAYIRADQTLGLLQLPAMQLLSPGSPPDPTTDSSGVIHLPVIATSLAFDQARGLLWAGGASANTGPISNAVFSVDSRGQVGALIDAGSELSSFALSPDSASLFAIQTGGDSVAQFDLETRSLVRTFPVSGTFFERPLSLMAVPGRLNAVVVAKSVSDGYYKSTVAVYESGVAQPRSISNFAPADQFGDTRKSINALAPGDVPGSFYAADLARSLADGSRSIHRLVLDPEGIRFERTLGAVNTGTSTGSLPLTQSSGSLFTGYGQVWSADLTLLKQTFGIDSFYASYSTPVVFPERNQVALYASDRSVERFSLILFDIGTGRPLASKIIAGVKAMVRLGNDTLAVATSAEILLIPLDSLTTWPSSTPVLKALSVGVRQMNLNVNAMAGLPGTSKLVVTIPSSSGATGNSVAILDPDSGRLENTIFVGSGPDKLAVSPDGATAYVRLSGERHIGLVNLKNLSRDAVFSADPTGGSNQDIVYDMAFIPSGGLAVSYYGGAVAVFDGATPRPQVEYDSKGSFAFEGGTYKIGVNEAGDRLYAIQDHWSPGALRRIEISRDGLRWLSTLEDFDTNATFKMGGGLLYFDRGTVYDLERSRLVGRLGGDPVRPVFAVTPDKNANRIFTVEGDLVKVYDIHTLAQIGQMTLPRTDSSTNFFELIRYGADGLVLRGAPYSLLIDISAIPPLAKPPTAPQPSLPSTPGVTVVDLKAVDLACSSVTGTLYGSIPNREAALGDKIVEIDVETGAIRSARPSGSNPTFLALTEDASALFYVSGGTGSIVLSTFSPTSENLWRLDLGSGENHKAIDLMPSQISSLSVSDFAILPGQSRSVASTGSLNQLTVVDAAYFSYSVSLGVSVFDDPTPRPTAVPPLAVTCTSLVAGFVPSRLYCSNGQTFWRLAVDSDGVSVQDSFPLLIGRGIFGHMVSQGGRVYTTNGVILDPEKARAVNRLEAQGPVAAASATVTWLDPSLSPESGRLFYTLKTFDVDTFKQIRTKQVNVTALNASRLVDCGQGRLAFAAGNEIYLVRPF